MCSHCGDATCKGCKTKCLPAKIAAVLVYIGALNWGLTGLGAFLGINLNVVNLILGGVPRVEWIVYILVGISAVVMMIGCKCKTCMPESVGGQTGMEGMKM